jgi:hypothetical protein
MLYNLCQTITTTISIKKNYIDNTVLITQYPKNLILIDNLQ